MTEIPIQRIAVPNPFFEGATNVYVIAGKVPTLIDTGIGTEEGFQVLQQGLKAHGLCVESLQQIVLTHHHLDHFGLARKLHDISGAKVYVHADDWEAVTHYEAWHVGFVERLQDRLEAWGTPESAVVEVKRVLQYGGKMLAQSTPAESLVDGQRLELGNGDIEVVHTPGHSRGSICLRHGPHLFSGDHVLPRVSPNIGGGEPGTPGTLKGYLDSLARVEKYQTKDLWVYPGHGEPFTDLSGRVRALQAHHRQRDQAILTLLAGQAPMTVYQIATGIFGKLQSFHVALGMAEGYAHLEKLESDGRVVRSDGRYSLPN
jgi:glyoxylase-like metal-dependent hydrolase (beta-lactamase superfamily II)